MLHVRHRRTHEVRDAREHLELDLLGVDQDQLHFLRRAREQEAREDRVHAHRLARAGRAGDEQVRHAREVLDHGRALGVDAEEQRQAEVLAVVGFLANDLGDAHRAPRGARHLDADHGLAGDRRDDAHGRGLERASDLLLQAGDLVEARAGGDLELEQHDGRADLGLDHRRIDLVRAQHRLERARLRLETILAPRALGLGGDQQRERRVGPVVDAVGRQLEVERRLLLHYLGLGALGQLLREAAALLGELGLVDRGQHDRLVVGRRQHELSRGSGGADVAVLAVAEALGGARRDGRRHGLEHVHADVLVVVDDVVLVERVLASRARGLGGAHLRRGDRSRAARATFGRDERIRRRADVVAAHEVPQAEHEPPHPQRDRAQERLPAFLAPLARPLAEGRERGIERHLGGEHERHRGEHRQQDPQAAVAKLLDEHGRQAEREPAAGSVRRARRRLHRALGVDGELDDAREGEHEAQSGDEAQRGELHFLARHEHRAPRAAEHAQERARIAGGREGALGVVVADESAPVVALGLRIARRRVEAQHRHAEPQGQSDQEQSLDLLDVRGGLALLGRRELALLLALALLRRLIGRTRLARAASQQTASPRARAREEPLRFFRLCRIFPRHPHTPRNRSRERGRAQEFARS